MVVGDAFQKPGTEIVGSASARFYLIILWAFNVRSGHRPFLTRLLFELNISRHIKRVSASNSDFE